jgi:type I restriction enzyme, S subunit
MRNDRVFQAISEAAFINPPLTRVVGPDDEVSFIPMADVSESGQRVGNQTRRQREVSVGYTPFEEGDVLFAKITPCMENGKGCHAIGLVNGVGYGSTEFHVLRAKPGTDNRFLYYWSTTKVARKKAEAFMIGSAGQQRVQASFFDHFFIPRLEEKEQKFAVQ